MAMVPEQGTAGGGRMCCIAWCVAEGSSTGCQFNAMLIQRADYEYIQVTWGIKIANFLIKMESFPPNQLGGKSVSKKRKNAFN